MKLLLTNDDGIDAPGLAALEEAVRGWGTALVVAPDRHLSGCSHQATTDRPLAGEEVAPGRHRLDGTPADCTRIGLLHLAPDAKWVLSGINDGGNLGHDVYLSGTVAAAREAALLGRPSIAFSQYRAAKQPADWPFAVQMAKTVMAQLVELPLAPGAFWNVNFPHLVGTREMPDVVICPLDPHPLPVEYEMRDGSWHYRGVYHLRQRKSGADVDVCFSGAIAVTQVLLCSGEVDPKHIIV